MPTVPINAIQLKNEMLDFVFGYSTKRVSPYNTDPYDGFISAPVTPTGVSAPAGYLPTTFKAVGDLPSDYREWLVVSVDGLSFMLWDDTKLGYFPYDLALCGLPIFRPRVQGISEGEAGTRFVNPYFDPIGRSTSDLFPPSLSDGVAPIHQATIFSNVPPSAPYQRNVPQYPFIPADWGGVHNPDGSQSGQFVANLSVTDYYGTPWTEIFTGSPGPQQYKVTIVGSVGVYLFNASDQGKSFYATYQYTAKFAPVLTGSVAPEDLEDPVVDDTAAGAPPNPGTFTWIYDDTGNPNTNSTAIADALVDDFPIVAPGSGFAAGAIVDIAGGTGAKAKVLTVDGSGGATSARLWQNGTGFTNGTKATSGGGGTGLTLAVTVVGTNRDKPVYLVNPEAPKVKDPVTGNLVTSLSMRNVNSGKRFLVAATKTSSNPATGPVNLGFPLATVDADNPILAAKIRSYGIDPTSKTNPVAPGNIAFGYSVEDNAWSLLAVTPWAGHWGCNPIPLPSECVYNFDRVVNGANIWLSCYNCNFEWVVNQVVPLGSNPGSGQSGGSSTAQDGNVCESVSDLADAMLGAGADPLELPALANILASTVSGNFSPAIPAVRPPYVPNYFEFAIMVETILNGGMGDLLTMIPQVTQAAIEISQRNLSALLNLSDVTQMFTVGFFTCAPQASGFLEPDSFVTTSPRTAVTIQPSGATVFLPTWNGPAPTAAQGFVNVPAGVNPLPISEATNPRGSPGYNIFSPFWKYSLPQGQNIWWYYGYINNEGDFQIDYGLMPIPVYVPNVPSPTPSPGLPPSGLFEVGCSANLGIPDITTGNNCG